MAGLGLARIGCITVCPGQQSVWAIDHRASDPRSEREDRRTTPRFQLPHLRRCPASLLIASGADIKTVQARMRHTSARTTLDTYGHLWPDADESTRTAIGAVIAERMDSAQTTADPLQTQKRSSGRRSKSAC
jgi:integrase